MVFLTNIDMRRTVRIKGIKQETSTVKSFTFDDKRCRGAKPGQYVMIWISGVDEIPTSLSAINHIGLSKVTVEKIGEATRALHEKRIGDKIGVRGPFGSGFKPIGGRVVVVGGGIGVAPLIPLTEDLVGLEADVVFVMGVKTKVQLLFLDELQTLLDKPNRIIVTTEDGSTGLKGLATDVLEGLFNEMEFEMVYTCGSELMMRKVFDIAEKHELTIQACMERIIRCSVGLCGSCVIGKIRICKNGPVLTSEQLREVIDEFGKFKRGLDGSKINF